MDELLIAQITNALTLAALTQVLGGVSAPSKLDTQTKKLVAGKLKTFATIRARLEIALRALDRGETVEFPGETGETPPTIIRSVPDPTFKDTSSLHRITPLPESGDSFDVWMGDLRAGLSNSGILSEVPARTLLHATVYATLFSSSTSAMETLVCDRVALPPPSSVPMAFMKYLPPELATWLSEELSRKPETTTAPVRACHRICGATAKVAPQMPKTKMRPHQEVQVRNRLTQDLLHTLCEGKDPDDLLFTALKGKKAKLTAVFQAGLIECGVPIGSYVFHGIRHGMAGHAWLHGIPFDEIRVRLTHQVERSTEIYLNGKKASLLTDGLPRGEPELVAKWTKLHLCAYFGYIGHGDDCPLPLP